MEKIKQDFKIGDCVTVLNIPGPDMIVYALDFYRPEEKYPFPYEREEEFPNTEYSGYVRCFWFGKNDEIQTKKFSQKLLVSI